MIVELLLLLIVILLSLIAFSLVVLVWQLGLWEKGSCWNCYQTKHGWSKNKQGYLCCNVCGMRKNE